jgi:hypothetical protein
MKDLARKVINDEDLHQTGLNFLFACGIAFIANTAANSLFHFNLNEYNSTKHFVAGVAIGTFAYRKAGGGAKGVLIGLAAATGCNALWEGFELGVNPYNVAESPVDLMSDVAIVYGGAVLSFVGEKWKDFINRD